MGGALKQVAGRFEPEENILHLWFPDPVHLDDEAGVRAFFDEVIQDWIDPQTGKFYLLVNYDNLHISPKMTSPYAANIGRFQQRLLGTFRYRIGKDFTGVAVSLGNMELHAPANLFPDEATAREAIRRAQAPTRR